jgi:outer membrane protein
MKKFMPILLLVCTTFVSNYAQSIAVIDINDVLNSMEDYRQAEAALDAEASKWRQEIAEEYDKIKSMYNKFQAESPLLTNDMKVQKENEIIEKEEQVRNLQRQRFGPEGDLFRKRQELVAPVQEKVFGAIEDFAADRGYDLIFDKNGSAGILFTSDNFDKTADLKKRLGIKN